MKKLVILFSAIVLMAGFSVNLLAQATENTAAAANIIVPITLLETAALDFGTMAVLGATPGTCVLATDGTRSATGGVNLSAQAPTATNAVYTVGGALNTTYAITLPANITVTNGTPAEDMIINALLAHTTSAGIDGLTGTLSGSGADFFTIGGTLNVAAAQPAGAYTGTFNVTVAYN